MRQTPILDIVGHGQDLQYLRDLAESLGVAADRVIFRGSNATTGSGPTIS